MKRTLWSATGMIGSLLLIVSSGFSSSSIPPKKTPELMKDGKKIYEQVCASCHGPQGDGKGPAGAALKPVPTDFQKPLKEWPNTKGNPGNILEVISKGISNTAMIAWAQYSEEQRWALVYTVMEFSSSGRKAK